MPKTTIGKENEGCDLNPTVSSEDRKKCRRIRNAKGSEKCRDCHKGSLVSRQYGIFSREAIAQRIFPSQ